jgi:hypothetical protein
MTAADAMLRPLVIGVLVLGAAAAAAAPVHLTVNTGTAREYGAGFSVRRGGDCLVLAPHHVVEWATENGIRVTDTNGRAATATVVKVVEEFDAALLAVAAGDVECGAPFAGPPPSPRALDTAEYVVAVKVDDAGRTRKTRLFVRATSNEHIELEPFGAADSIGEGDSGSGLFLGDEWVGMVLAVDTASGKVTGVTASQLRGLFGPDLADTAPLVVALAPIRIQRREDADATVAARAYLATLGAYKLIDAPLDRRTREALLPDGARYLVSGEIVRISPRRAPNPDYDPAQGPDAPNRYVVTYDIEIDIAIFDAVSNATTHNLERRQYKHVAPSGYLGELQNTAIATAVRDALAATLAKYPLSRS